MKIWAWGANTNGQLGLGFNSEQESVPTLVDFSFSSDYKDAEIALKDISGGASSTLCLAIVTRHDSQPQAEAESYDDEGDYNVMSDALGKSPLEIIKVTDTFQILCFSKEKLQSEQIATGFDSYFYLFKHGEVKSFGDNGYFQLGRKISDQELQDQKLQDQKLQGTESVSDKKNFTKLWGGFDQEEFAQLNLEIPFLSSISVGLRHVAALSYSNDLYVWGDNSRFQGGIFRLGPTGDVELFPNRVEIPTRVEFPHGYKFIKVAAGKDFTIAVHESGCLFGCGRNKYGVLLHAPQDIGEFKKFTHIFDHLSCYCDIVDIQCGWSHVLVLLSDGKVISWGRNTLGQLGRKSVNPDFDVEPGYVHFSEKIMSIRCGSEHNLALSITGKVYAWGWNEHHNCGVKTLDTNVEPMVLEGENVEDTDTPSQPVAWKKDCILVPTLVPFPEDVTVSVIGCGAGSSYAISSDFVDVEKLRSELQTKSQIVELYTEIIRELKEGNFKMPVIFSPEGMVEQIMKNPATALNKEICASHIIKVWETVAGCIIQQLCKGRGVRIPHLAVITYKIKTIEMSSREVMVQKIPHIFLSSEIEKRHGLKVKRPVYNLDVPEVDLNLSTIAQCTNMSRAHVELCMDEIICAFNRALMCDPQVEFWFPKIGRIVVQCAEVDVVFSTDFLNLLGYSDEFVQDKACPLR